MVKDLLREIKRKWLQFIAITLITMLGVGFYVGIQVTGYDMRQTADAYMVEKSVMDFTLRHSMGMDQEMIDEIKDIIGGTVSGIIDDDSFARGGNLDDVVKVYLYTDATKEDLTVIEGRNPNQQGEVVIDHVMKALYHFELGDTFTIFGNQIFETQEVEVVGFVESSLYLNLERGQSQLGVGRISGFVYGMELQMQSDEILYTAARVKDAEVDDVNYTLEKHAETLSQNRFDLLIVPELEKLAQAQSDLDAGKKEAELGFADAEREMDKAQAQLDDAYKKLEDGLNQLSGGIVLSGTVEERLNLVKLNYQTMKNLMESTIDGLKQRIAETENEMVKEVLQKELDAGLIELDAMNQQYEVGINQLDAGLKQYQAGVTELEKNRALFESEKASILAELEDAQSKIDKGYEEIENADHGVLYIFDRAGSIIGYREFYDDSNRIEKIGQVFPIIFFFVAVLITLSTVTRLIEENRMEMGVYKALGYSPIKTALKYILFSGISWLVGMGLGLYFGFYFIPGIIYDAYRIMYQTPELVDGIVLSYAIVPVVVSFLSSVGVTYVKSMRVSKETTANLLRPVAPKKGQRIMLERMPFIWKRLSFLYKVSFRNLFRNKTRFLMTILGIGGTTGILIVGFGLSYSINSITDKQFMEIIHYDGLAYVEAIDFDTSVFESYVPVYVEGITLGNHEVSLYVAEDMKLFNEFISFSDRKSNQVLEYDYEDVVLTEKIAKLSNLKVGDAFNIRLDNKNISLTVGAITENYTGHNIYMSQDTIESILGSAPDSNMILFKKGDLENDTLAENLLKNESVVTVQFVDEISQTYRSMTENFDIVLWVVLGAALVLEVLVLVNLISMNMSERKKELATLKVLGFNKQELATYILRENIILTMMASIFGFIFGKLLHYFVVTQAEIDLVMFNYDLLWTSYAWAFVFTMGLSVLINYVMTRRTNRVNMSEALKTFDG